MRKCGAWGYGSGGKWGWVGSDRVKGERGVHTEHRGVFVV